jgi:hypothetical protein
MSQKFLTNESNNKALSLFVANDARGIFQIVPKFYKKADNLKSGY